MSTIIRTALVAIALLGTVSAASAHDHWYGKNYHGYGYKHGYWTGKTGYWTKSSEGKWKKHDTADFFRQLKRNSGS